TGSPGSRSTRRSSATSAPVVTSCARPASPGPVPRPRAVPRTPRRRRGAASAGAPVPVPRRRWQAGRPAGSSPRATGYCLPASHGRATLRCYRLIARLAPYEENRMPVRRWCAVVVALVAGGVPGGYAYATPDATADIALSASASGPAVPGQPLPWTVTATNHGPSAADSVAATQTVPLGPGERFTSAIS